MRMKKLGREIIDPADLPTHGQVRRRRKRQCSMYEFKADLNHYLARRAGTARSDACRT